MAKQKSPLPPTDRRTQVDDKRKAQLAKQGWTKGKSGNPAGRPPLPKEIKDALRQRSLRAIDVMEDLMENCENAATKQRAAAYFIDPFVARAAPDVNVNHTVRHHVADLLQMVNSGNANVIEGQVVEALEYEPGEEEDTE